MGGGLALIALAIVAVLLSAAAVPSGYTVGQATGAPRPGATTTGPSRSGDAANTTGFPTPIRHVVVIPFENADISTVLQDGPFFRYLAEHYAVASNYYAICHPSAPNYLALTSGKTWQCGSDGYQVYNSTNIGILLQSAGLSWAAYMDSMPIACDTNNAYPYMVKHDPFVYYQDIVGNTSLCDTHVLPLSAWNETVANGTIPNFSFITPNMLNDGHDTSVSYADHWLRGFLGPDLNATWMNDTVIFITFDEGYLPGGAPDDSGYNGTAGGHVYFAAISPFVPTNSTYLPDASHYNLLSTIEWLLGLPSTGHNDSAAFPAMKSLFDFQVPLAVAPSASPMVGPAPLTVQLTASVGNGVAPFEYNWSFGDGNGSNLSAPTHTYSRPGIYTVNVTVRDAMNQSGAGSFEVIAANSSSPVHVGVTANRTHIAAPGNVTLAANISGGTPPYQVRWFYNDGAPSENGSTQHVVFVKPGNYTVEVAVIDADGAIGAGTIGIQVVAPLAVSLLVSNEFVDVGTQVNLTAVAQGGNPEARTYSWTLNGTPIGTNSSQLIYTPKGGGNFTVAVAVKDNFNESASATGMFNVTGAPPPPHNGSPPPPSGPTTPFLSTTEILGIGLAIVVLGVLIGYAVFRRRSRPPPPTATTAPIDRTDAGPEPPVATAGAPPDGPDLPSGTGPPPAPPPT